MKAKARTARKAKATEKAADPAKGSGRGRRPRPATGEAVPPEALPIVCRTAAGIDCGATEHYVAVPPDCVPPGEAAVRCFSAFTFGLESMVDWLKRCGVSTEAAVYGTSGGRRMAEPVAIESTGVYWIALFQKLEEAGLRPLLVNAREVKHVPGRKTDVKDSQWLQKLHSFGLLSASPSTGSRP